MLDADTGKLKWHYQFTPHDVHDYDSTEVPILADMTINGQPRKTVMFANRNGFYYTLDRITGKIIVAKPFVKTTWAKEIDAQGRPMLEPGHTPDEKGEVTCPDLTGGTNFWPPSYDPRTNLFFVNAREACATFYAYKPEYVAGERFAGGAQRNQSDLRCAARYRSVTGERRWEFRYASPTSAGVPSTASGLVFAGDSEGNFMAFDGRTGKDLWHYQMGGPVFASANTYMLDGRQYLVLGSGTTLTAFALPRSR